MPKSKKPKKVKAVKMPKKPKNTPAAAAASNDEGAGPSRMNEGAGPSRMNESAGPSRMNEGAGPSRMPKSKIKIGNFLKKKPKNTTATAAASNDEAGPSRMPKKSKIKIGNFMKKKPKNRNTPASNEGAGSSRRMDIRLDMEPSDSEGPLPPRTPTHASLAQRKAQQVQKNFCKAIQGKDIETIRLYQTGSKKSLIAINKVYEKESADPLTLAVKTKDVNVVQEILKFRNVYTRNGFLSAIQLKYMDIVKAILNFHGGDANKAAEVIKDNNNAENTKSSDFDDYITPLMVAAAAGSYDLIELLFKEEIKLPHKPKCNCRECEECNRNYEGAYKRLEIFKAIADPNYLAVLAGHTEKDPIEHCFEMIDYIGECSELEPEYLEAYVECSDAFEKICVDLLALCRSDEEVCLFMSKKSHTKIALHDNSANDIAIQYPRLVNALTSRKKNFVTHPNSQSLLFQLWKFSSFFGSTSLPYKVVLFVLLSIPSFFWGMYMIFDPALIRTKYGRPQARCWFSSTFYIFFLSLLVYWHSYCNTFTSHGAHHNALKIIIVYLELNYIVIFFYNVYQRLTFKTPFDNWDYLELFDHILFLIVFGFWLDIGINPFPVGIHNENYKFEKHNSYLMADAFMTVAVTLAFLRFMKIFVLDKQLGPIQGCLGKVLKTFGIFLIFYLTANISYALGLHYLYRPFQGWTDGEKNQTDKFNSFLGSMENLLWSAGAVGDAQATKVIKTLLHINCSNIKTKEKSPRCNHEIEVFAHHYFTQHFGTILFAFYYFFTGTMIMNMMTGVFGSIYEKISGSLDVEWKFLRSEVWMYYMRDRLAPPPFTVFSLIALWCSTCCGSMKPKKNDDKAKEDRLWEYRILIKHLFQRYFRNSFKEQSEEKPTKDNVETAKANIKDLTQRIKNIQKGGDNSEKETKVTRRTSI